MLRGEQTRQRYAAALAAAMTHERKRIYDGNVIAIALVDAVCQEKVIAAAKRIGNVVVDHGDTNCKTPDAVSYMTKCIEHRAKRAEKRAAWG